MPQQGPAPPTPMPLAKSGRNTNLDALRAIAIFMVLGRHSDYFIRHWATVGWAGVDLFFVLSGFLIAGLLFNSYRNRGKVDIFRFYIRRGFKIWPAFYALILATLLINALLPSFALDTKHLWSEVLFLQSYLPGVWGITWSLAVEEHFYLSLPLVLLLMARRGGGKPFAAMPYLFCAVAVFSLACRFAVGWKEDGSNHYLTYLYPTHLRIDGLMFGVLLSYYYHFQPQVFQRIASWRATWILVVAACILLLKLPPEDRHMHTWGLTVLYLAAGCVVAKAVAFEGALPVRIVSGWLARIGVYSYSIYLWHLFYRHFLRHVQMPWPWLWGVCFFAGAILFGIAAAKLIEIPVLGFRDRMFPAQSGSIRRAPPAAIH